MNHLELNLRVLRNRFVLSPHCLTLTIHEIVKVADMFRALRYVDQLLRNPPPAVVEAFNRTGHQIEHSNGCGSSEDVPLASPGRDLWARGRRFLSPPRHQGAS